MHEYEKANGVDGPMSSERTGSQLRWTKPDRGWVKVNVDAALDRKDGRMGFGIILRDHEGKVLVAKSIAWVGSLDSLAAEAMAAYFGVIVGHEQGVQHLILEGDAKQKTNAIQDECKNHSLIGHLIDDVKTGLNVYSKWKVEHVHREANKVAHNLAKLAIQQATDSVWLDEGPSCIGDILLVEQLFCQ